MMMRCALKNVARAFARSKRVSFLFASMTVMLGIGSAQAQTDTLKVAGYFGSFRAAQQKYVADRFTAKTGVKIEWVDGSPTDHLQKMIASRGRAAPFDVVYLDDTVQPQAVALNTVIKLDEVGVPNLKFVHERAKEKDGYGPAIFFWSWGMLYNVEAFQKAGIPEPTSWNDLWDPRLDGKVALPDITGPGGRDLVMKATELAGGGADDFEAGLKKVSEIKPLSYFPSTVDLRAKLLAGEAWVAPFNNGQSNLLIDQGYPGKFIYPKEGGYLHLATIDVVAGTENEALAKEFINFALDPVGQIGSAFDVPYGPVNVTLEDVLKGYPELAKKFPSTEADFASLKTADWGQISKQWSQVVDLWNRTVIRQ